MRGWRLHRPEESRIDPGWSQSAEISSVSAASVPETEVLPASRENSSEPSNRCPPTSSRASVNASAPELPTAMPCSAISCARIGGEEGTPIQRSTAFNERIRVVRSPSNVPLTPGVQVPAKAGSAGRAVILRTAWLGRPREARAARRLGPRGDGFAAPDAGQGKVEGTADLRPLEPAVDVLDQGVEAEVRADDFRHATFHVDARQKRRRLDDDFFGEIARGVEIDDAVGSATLRSGGESPRTSPRGRDRSRRSAR